MTEDKQVITRPPGPYGKCPTCGEDLVLRERRPDGDDICRGGHKSPSKDNHPTQKVADTAK